MKKEDIYMVNPVNFDRIADNWATAMNRRLAENRVDMLCVDMINWRITHMLYMIADTLATPDLLTDRDNLRILCNMNVLSIPMVRCLQKVNTKPRVDIVLESAHRINTTDKWIKDIKDGLMSIVCWTIWNGGDGQSIRKHIARKAQRDIIRIEKEIGVNGILTIWERSLVAFENLREKLFLPKYRELTKQSYNDNPVSFNTIQWRI